MKVVDLTEHIDHWQRLSDEATLPAKKALFARTAESLRMEEVDGVWRCACHLLTREACIKASRK